MKKNDVIAGAVFAAGLVAAVDVGGRVRPVHGQESAPPTPPTAVGWQLVTFDKREQKVIEQTIQSLLAELGPGFTINVTKTVPSLCAEGACAEKTACEEMIARIGVDADARVCEANCAELPAKFVGLGCPCTEAGECDCAEAACGSDCGAACKCCPCGTAATCATKNPAALAAHTAHVVSQASKEEAHEHCPLMEHLPRLIAEQAAATAELASRKEASEKFSELYETMAELIAANAALHAKLEAQEEHVQLIHKMAELATENARLKAHVELAGGHAGAGQHALTLTVENERLKQRVTELEHKHAEVEAARSAARGRSEKRAR